MTRVLCWLGLALSLSGCGAHFRVQAPAHFAILDSEDRFAFRATSAEGVVLAVRETENTAHASAVFWTTAIRRRLERAGGYALLGEEDVRSRAGREGRRLRFGRDEAGVTYDYWVVVFVSADRIHVLEAGGQRPLFEAERTAIEAAIATFEPG